MRRTESVRFVVIQDLFQEKKETNETQKASLLACAAAVVVVVVTLDMCA